MNFDRIDFGDNVEISLKIGDNISSKTYTTRVEKSDYTSEITLLSPMSFGEVINLPLGDKYIFLFITSTGMYRFNGAVVGYSEVDEFQCTEIKLLSKGEKVQRREHFRQSCFIEMEFQKIEEEHVITNDTYKSVIRNICGGGIKINSDEPLEVDDYIECPIVLDKEYILANARILYKKELIDNKYRYEYRAEFVNMLESDRDKIVKYVFTKQRDSLVRKNP